MRSALDGIFRGKPSAADPRAALFLVWRWRVIFRHLRQAATSRPLLHVGEGEEGGRLRPQANMPALFSNPSMTGWPWWLGVDGSSAQVAASVYHGPQAWPEPGVRKPACTSRHLSKGAAIRAERERNLGTRCRAPDPIRKNAGARRFPLLSRPAQCPSPEHPALDRYHRTPALGALRPFRTGCGHSAPCAERTDPAGMIHNIDPAGCCSHSPSGNPAGRTGEAGALARKARLLRICDSASTRTGMGATPRRSRGAGAGDVQPFVCGGMRQS